MENNLTTKISNCEEVFWVNEECNSETDIFEVNKKDVDEAELRLKRFTPLIMKYFPETICSGGIIESPLTEILEMKNRLEKNFKIKIPGKLFIKQDNELPISGSVKARGGIHEVLEHAENLALKNEIISNTEDDYLKIANNNSKSFFKQNKLQVGSTGNLGLSIGIMGAAIGFETIVHMSSDAKQWKKDLLRQKGATVIEYSGDYGLAVKKGRENSDSNPYSYFIDDEKSKSLFCGYAVAARRLKKQLDEKSILVDEKHPLFVYLPCGVGGAPGGITFGLKQIFGDKVHCFFIEPTHAPCMLLGLVTKKYNEISIQDYGIDGKTLADGLAVGRCSAFVGKIMSKLVSGESTVDDNKLSVFQKDLWKSNRIYIEPSSCAAFQGLKFINSYMDMKKISGIENSTHIIWATGGAMVPTEIKKKELGEKIL